MEIEHGRRIAGAISLPPPRVDVLATSLLAVVPTAGVGAWRRARYGSLRSGPPSSSAVASIVGVEAGVLIATSLPEHVLRRLFGLLLIAVAMQLAWRASFGRGSYPDD